jgi:HlyD family secretion protein
VPIPGQPTLAAPGAAGTTPPVEPRRLPWRLLFIGAVVLAVAVVVIVLIVRALFPAAPPTQLSVSGRLEGYQSDLGAKVGRSVVWVAVREGCGRSRGAGVSGVPESPVRYRFVLFCRPFPPHRSGR